MTTSHGKALGTLAIWLLVISFSMAENDNNRSLIEHWAVPDRFSVPSDTNVVLDTLTGLLWTRNANLPGKKISWNEAVAYCDTLEYGGFSDWRLPNIEELQSLIDPKLPFKELFAGFIKDYYWTSFTHLENNTSAWTMAPGRGSLFPANKSEGKAYIWPVRGTTTERALRERKRVE